MGRDNFVAPYPVDVLGDVLGGPKAHGPVEVPVGKIKTDGGTQMRAGLDDATVFEYGQAMIAANGWGTFPPVIAYHDGKDYWLADGFHRVAAFLESFPDLKRKIPVEVRAGTRRDAVLHAAGANAQHGLRRTNQDKRRAVETLLRDAEWAAWSDREIAKACNVDHKTVASLRSSLGNSPVTERTYTTKHGTTATMQTGNIGSNQPARKPAPVLNTAPAGEHGEWLAGLDADFETAKAGRRVVTLDELPVIASVTVPARSQAEIDAAIDEEIALARQHVRNGVEARRDEDEQITHPLDCYEDETTNAHVGKMGKLQELKMWLKQTRDEKTREYAKLTGCEAPAALGAAIDQMLEAIEQAMDTVESEAANA